MPVVMVANNKGGVGKSALVTALAAAHARRRRRTLCIDMDPQANLSRRLGFGAGVDSTRPTLAEAIKADDTGCAADIVFRCAWDDECAEYIDLLPSRFDLENRVSEAGTVGANLRLQNITDGVLDPYDWVFIDCPPSLGHLTQMAMVLAGQDQPKSGPGWAMIVVEPEFDGMAGAVRMNDFTKRYGKALGVPGLAVRAVIVNRVRTGTDLHVTNIQQIRDHFGPLVWEPELPLWVAMADAMNTAVPVHSLPGPKAADLTSRIQTLADRMETVS